VTDYFVDGYDLSHLFDSSLGSIEFSEDPRKHIPDNGSIIYSVWDQQQKFIYIGISGLQKSLEKRNPLSRMISHASGLRSGDQFCVYIHDFFVIPNLLKEKSYKPERGSLDKLTKQYIHENLSYRFISFNSDDSDAIVRRLENEIKSGALGLKPLLNGTPTPSKLTTKT
jgi:hypothetical protein